MIRGATLAGVIYTAPFGVWLFASAPGDGAALRALLLVQLIALALWLPAQPPGALRRELSAVAVFLILPLPLVSLLWLQGRSSLDALLFASLLLLALASAVVVVTRLGRSIRYGQPLVLAGIQLTLPCVLWAARGQWLGVLPG